MENLKIRMNSEAESKEVQALLVVLGATCCSGLERNKNANFLFMNSGFVTACKLQENFDKSKCKEITLPELRDLIVLKRNDVRDATHVDQYGDKWIFVSGIWYFYSGKNKWDESLSGLMNRYDLKPITKEEGMKEYLNKETHAYVKTHDLVSKDSNWIEIPDGAETLNYFDDKENLFFLKSIGKDTMFSNDLNDWEWKEWGDIDFDGVVCLWSRNTHPEELPFIDDEPLLQTEIESELDQVENLRELLTPYTQPLNDQYAEIEKVRQTLNQRQEQYGSFEDVAMITEQMVDVMRKGYYENLAYNQKMALYMICSKMARIVNGNPNHKDSWHDIAGYATLIDNELVSEKDMPF